MSQHAKQILYAIVTVSLESKIHVFGNDSKKSKPAPDPVLSQ
jgi:beta-phosphoglucomutase-like phosphatase (HAD superfamily)